jgi:hypothetical protein
MEDNLIYFAFLLIEVQILERWSVWIIVIALLSFRYLLSEWSICVVYQKIQKYPKAHFL